MKTIYFDHSATTPVDPRVLDAMLPFFQKEWGNPSSIYGIARAAKKAVEDAREQVAHLIGAQPQEIVFTSGGTEADNMVLRGVARNGRKKGKHIITSAIEHHAILHTAEDLEKEGYDVTYLPVDEFGMVNPDDLSRAIRPDTILISIMYANNEIGTIMPIKELGHIAKENNILFHTDGVQAVGQLEIDVKEENIDLLSLSGHKIYGPKGIGALYIRQGVRLSPLITGGAQERKWRPGTENVPGIVGMGKAAQLAKEERDARNRHLLGLREKLITGVMERVGNVRLNGHPEKRLPNNAHFAFEFIEGESLLLNLDIKGIAGSSGSACTSGSLEPSHVLLAIGLPHELAHGSLRLTLGQNNTEAEVQHLLEVLPPIVEKLRAMSPLTP